MRLGQALWPVLALVVSGHWAVLTVVTAAVPAAAPHGRGTAVPVFQVRSLQPTPAAPQPEVQVLRPADVAQPAPAAAPAPVPVPVPPPAPVAASTLPPQAEPPYLPRGELTRTPQAQGPVDVPFPETVRGVVDLKVQLTLFIDERGAVQRVRIDTPDVAAVFEQAIRETFTQARFSPGELRGVAVRSQMRLEVEFHTAQSRR